MVHGDREVPQALSLSALTTTRPRPASAMTMMKRIAIAAVDAGHRADLACGDLGQRPAAAARRGPQDDEVVHRAGEAHAGDQPDEAGRVAELGREHGPDQRPGAGDGREVMAEEDPLSSGSSCGRRSACGPASAASRRAPGPAPR